MFPPPVGRGLFSLHWRLPSIRFLKIWAPPPFPDHLDVAADLVAVRAQVAAHRVVLDVGVHARVEHARLPALLHLDAAADSGALPHDEVLRVLALHVADHADVLREQARRA
jgi:hypothetical protein